MIFQKEDPFLISVRHDQFVMVQNTFCYCTHLPEYFMIVTIDDGFSFFSYPTVNRHVSKIYYLYNSLLLLENEVVSKNRTKLGSTTKLYVLVYEVINKKRYQ